jgi:DNA-binding PadR family transcriptional regulator
MISRNSMTGSDITKEIGKRKGSNPSPGTIYPALKFLKERGLIGADKKKMYSITAKGKKELDKELKIFLSTFSDVDDMKRCCR